jgi:hypothetical protein
VSYNVSTLDIESRWRPLSDAEADIALTLIDDTITLIDVYRPSLAPAVAAGQVSERVVVMTVVETVKRVLANPDLLSNQSITADGGVSIGWQFQMKETRPQLMLSMLDFANIDQAMAAAGIGTGTTGSLKMKNSTSWTKNAAYGGEFSEVDPGLMPYPTKSDQTITTDSVVIERN